MNRFNIFCLIFILNFSGGAQAALLFNSTLDFSTEQKSEILQLMALKEQEVTTGKIPYDYKILEKELNEKYGDNSITIEEIPNTVWNLFILNKTISEPKTMSRYSSDPFSFSNFRFRELEYSREFDFVREYSRKFKEEIRIEKDLDWNEIAISLLKSITLKKRASGGEVTSIDNALKTFKAEYDQSDFNKSLIVKSVEIESKAIQEKKVPLFRSSYDRIYIPKISDTPHFDLPLKLHGNTFKLFELKDLSFSSSILDGLFYDGSACSLAFFYNLSGRAKSDAVYYSLVIDPNEFQSKAQGIYIPQFLSNLRFFLKVKSFIHVYAL